MPYASMYDDTTYDPSGATRSRRVGAPPVQPTLSKLGQLLERERAARTNAPLESAPIPEGLLDATPAMRQPQPIPYPGVQTPEEMAHTSRGYKTFGNTPGTEPTDKLALLKEAPLGSKVERGVSGNYEVGAPKKPSRLMKALEGALSAAAMAGSSGPTEGSAMRMLGGAAVGGIGGGVKPRLVEKFQRENELAQLRGEIGENQSIAYKDAQITAAKAQPELRELQVKNTINESLLREQDRRADNARDERRVKATEEANRIRENRNKALADKTTSTEEITVAGRKFKVSPSTAARILEERTKAANKPEPASETAAREASIEAELEDEAGNDHLTKRREADEQASQLRAAREKLTHKSVKNADNTWGWAEDKHQAERNAKSIADIDRQITEAEKESTYRQKEADDAFSRRNKAKAKGGSTAGRSSTKAGRTIEGAIAAFEKSRKRKPTATEIENMRAALNR